ncbi:uncharacterized protein LOC107844376 [Capsicum annuum]|uniref:uncharacterized protein LOC107844376 n=1 Tax=Capsicum annuum TaxID=4072 RepID=UPI0007BF36C7|nr:uncharacterized protein LOC107844376 [Capsicum annuum]
MVVALRYVNKNDKVNERVIAIVRVGDTSETPSAYCIHCFAHQLQLTLVAVAKKYLLVDDFFAIITNVLNVMGASFKLRDKLRDHQAEILEQLLESCEVQSEKGWDALMNEVRVFYDKHEILVPKMDNFYLPKNLNRRPSSVTYSHHLRVELFYTIIDFQLQELNNHFDVVSGNLLIGMAILNPSNAFANFDKEKIMLLAEHYPDEFGELKLRELSYQLDTFIIHMRRGDPIFSNLKEIGDLAEALVNTNLVKTYSLVYLLVKLTLFLPVATATVEKVFLSMKHIKNELHNSIGDAFLSDCIVCYIEKDIFVNISNDAIIDHF